MAVSVGDQVMVKGLGLRAVVVETALSYRGAEGGEARPVGLKILWVGPQSQPYTQVLPEAAVEVQP